MRKITVERGQVEEAEGERGRAEGVAYRIDGELWTHVGTLGLWLRDCGAGAGDCCEMHLVVWPKFQTCDYQYFS